MSVTTGALVSASARLARENCLLRSLVELMAMRIPVQHMPEAERTLLAEVLDG